MAEEQKNPFAPPKDDSGADTDPGTEQQKPDVTPTRNPNPPDDDNGDDTASSQGNDLAAMQRALKKANSEAARFRKQLQDIADKDKSELQRASERAERAEREAQEATSRAMRFEVATAKGLPAGLASRLQGATREELEADAEELLKLAGPAKTPRRDPDQGKRDANGSAAPDMNDWMRKASGIRTV